MKYSQKYIQQIQNEKEFKFKKKFGQNFIIDENTINNIINKSEIDKNTLVIEIGPGIGSLTTKLSDSAKQVLCYEIDKTLEDILSETLFEKNNVDINFIDFLKADVKEDIKKYNYDKLYVVANLPYYITTPIINKIIDEQINVEKIVIMVQKEVGNRLSAKVGTKDYNSLSIFINYYYEVKKILDVSKNIFIPVPNVDSIVIELKKKQIDKKVLNETLLFQLIRDSFKQKRKTLGNNLKNYNLEKISEVLKNHNMSLMTRAEQISLDIFIDIANELEEELNV